MSELTTQIKFKINSE